MGKLIYAVIASLDGYIADENGNFDWATPSDELHAFVNDLQRPMGTYLYGRRLYETMIYWETAHLAPGQDPVGRDYAAIWQQARKIVYSRTLTEVTSARTELVREFDPAAVRGLKRSSDSDLAIGGAELAAQAIREDLVDEYQVFLTPVIVGGGKSALPRGLRQPLDLVDERRFDNGTIWLRYTLGA